MREILLTEHVRAPWLYFAARPGHPPIVAAANDFLPAMSTSDTVLVSPGSKRTAVPAGISSRFAVGLAAVETQLRLVSMK